MATVAELNAKLAENQAALDAMQQRVTDAEAVAKAAYDQLKTQNEALQAAYDELLANPNVPNESLTSLQAAIDDANAFMQSNPPPTP